MILRFFKPHPRRAAIESLYRRVAEASRAPTLYLCHGIADTGEGRFESLALHVILVLRRLRGLPPPADEVAQDLVDLTFSHLDAALRESGVGDLSVPRRMKTLAESFYGRAASYDAAFASGDHERLASALSRNVLGGSAHARGLADYARAAEERLARLDLDAMLNVSLLFPPVP
jgi:cytochrome b pre-mRNA-processing protein 3